MISFGMKSTLRFHKIVQGLGFRVYQKNGNNAGHPKDPRAYQTLGKRLGIG